VALQISSSWFPAKLRRISSGGSFWQARYYDFNVWSERKGVEKLDHIHCNAVKHGLLERPEDWRSSSF
jgi:putative transposase